MSDASAPGWAGSRRLSGGHVVRSEAALALLDLAEEIVAPGWPAWPAEGAQAVRARLGW